MNNIVTVVQARTGSTRLPGKVLERVGDRTVLEWVLHRVSLASRAGTVVVATSQRKQDAVIADLCRSLGVHVFRGPHLDVLSRYARCAAWYQADAVVRVTADCPLLCPDMLDLVVDVWESRPSLAYVGVQDGPAGLAQELISRRALVEADRRAIWSSHREHVVTWTLRDHGHQVVLLPSGLGRFSGSRFTVDTPADLARLRSLYGRFGDGLFEMDALSLCRESEQFELTLVDAILPGAFRQRAQTAAIEGDAL